MSAAYDDGQFGAASRIASPGRGGPAGAERGLVEKEMEREKTTIRTPQRNDNILTWTYTTTENHDAHRNVREGVLMSCHVHSSVRPFILPCIHLSYTSCGRKELTLTSPADH